MVDHKPLIIFLLILPFLINNASANGIMLTNQSTSSISKIFGENISFTFSIQNSEPFPMYNISFRNSSIVYMPTINKLESGQSAIITGVIYGDQKIDNYPIWVTGFYNATIGASNQTYNISIDYYSGLSKCSFSIVKGDKVRWKNTVADSIILRNADTGNDITQLSNGNEYQSSFESPMQLRYYCMRRGFIFTPICTITVLNDVGFINNPELDANINLSINIVYNPTNVTIQSIEKNYTMDAYGVQDGVLTISNTGNNTARSILLSGEWLTFSTNNFDLLPGQTKAVIYTIQPYLTSTSQTNQTHIKQITAVGNFMQVNDSISIFVKHAIVNNTNLSSNYQSLQEAINALCRANPSLSFCRTEPNVVYVGNGSDQMVNVTLSQEQIKNIFEYMFKQGDKQDNMDNFNKEKISTLEGILGNLTYSTVNVTSVLEDKITKMETDDQNFKANMITLGYATGFMATCAILGSLIYLIKRRNNAKEAQND